MYEDTLEIDQYVDEYKLKSAECVILTTYVSFMVVVNLIHP
jgi:hypothetical protein